MVPIAGPAISAGVKTALRAQELYTGEAEKADKGLRTNPRLPLALSLLRRLLYSDEVKLSPLPDD
jgi:hypothetical protein